VSLPLLLLTCSGADGAASGFSDLGGGVAVARSAILDERLDSALRETTSLRMSSWASIKVGNLSSRGSSVLRTLNLGFRPRISW
jgi:hypothetical protein